MKNYYIEQILNRILDMSPEQLEHMKSFFGIQDFDMDLVQSTVKSLTDPSVSRMSTDI